MNPNENGLVEALKDKIPKDYLFADCAKVGKE
jgi:hypothetical protein